MTSYTPTNSQGDGHRPEAVFFHHLQPYLPKVVELHLGVPFRECGAVEPLMQYRLLEPHRQDLRGPRADFFCVAESLRLGVQLELKAVMRSFNKPQCEYLCDFTQRVSMLAYVESEVERCKIRGTVGHRQRLQAFADMGVVRVQRRDRRGLPTEVHVSVPETAEQRALLVMPKRPVWVGNVDVLEFPALATYLDALGASHVSEIVRRMTNN